VITGITTGIIAYQEALIDKQEADRRNKKATQKLVPSNVVSTAATVGSNGTAGANTTQIAPAAEATPEEAKHAESPTDPIDASRIDEAQSPSQLPHQVQIASTATDQKSDTRLTAAALEAVTTSIAPAAAASTLSLRPRERRALLKVRGLKHPDPDANGKRTYRISELKRKISVSRVLTRAEFAMTCVTIPDNAPKYIKMTQFDDFIHSVLEYSQAYLRVLRFRQTHLHGKHALQEFQK
jgi:hypothetical protein